MTSPTISLPDSSAGESFFLKKDEVGSIAIPLKEQLQLDSYWDLQTFDGLAVARTAWSATLCRVSNSIKPPTLTELYIDESMTVVRVVLDPAAPLPSPPATPSIASIGPLMKQTIITYVKSAQDDQHDELAQLPGHLGALAAQTQVRLEIVQKASQWNMTVRFLVASVSQTQIEDLVDLFQEDLEESLQSLASNLPPSPLPEAISGGFLDGVYPSLCPKVERCIHDLVEEQATARPEQEAICAHDGSLSYIELSTISARISQKLSRLGAGPEERVAILMSKSRWYPVAVLAVLKAGAAFVPLDPNHPTARAQQLVQEMKPCVLITSALLSSKAQDLGCLSLLLIDQEDDPDDSLILPQPTTVVTPSNAAYIIFTSGSTGKPKGVVVEHSALATSAVTRGTAVGLGRASRVLQYAPHTFDVSVDEILTTLIHGGCVCIPSESDRFMIAQFMEATRVTAALLTPTSARTLSPDDVPTLKTLQTGGEVLAEDVNDKWSSRVTLFNVYGPTEASIACIMSDRTGIQGTGHVLGHAIGGSCWVVDTENVSQRMLPGEIGELVIAGPILARGYFGDPVKTEASFVRLEHTGERIYKTGDLASMDEAGIISYHGRKDLEIKIRGQRINIAEVEHALLQSDLVHSVVVEYPRSGPCANKLTAILCLNNDEGDSRNREPVTSYFEEAQGLPEDILALLHSHVADVLPSAMVPSKWLALTDFPQTTSTKVDRKQVRTWLETMGEQTNSRIFYGTDQTTSMGSTGSPSSPEASLLAVWCQVLKVEPRHVRLDQSFIRNGGDSIMAMEARHLAHDAGLVIDIRDLLAGRRLQEIAGRASLTSALGSVAPVEPDTASPFALSPVQQMYFDQIPDPKLGLQQRVCIEINRPIDADTMRSALNQLTRTHRMLGARFVTHEESWMQYIPDETNTYMDQPYGFYLGVPAPLDDFCTEPMDIEKGPLFHAHLLPSDSDGQKLVLCAHHLVVDFVSWRIILHDLHHVLTVMQGDQPRQSPPRSTLTFQQWCRQQREYASSLDPQTVLQFSPGPIDLDFWQPPGGSPVPNTYAGLNHHEFRLSPTQTARILARFNNLPSTHPTDAMIGAFATAFRGVFAEREAPTVFVEGHGREPWQPSLDVSHTVGWFTAAYPLHIPADQLNGLREAICAAGERRRATPANGHPYWACRYLSPNGREMFANDKRHQQMEVVFNYAGTVVQRAPGQGLFGEEVRTTEVGHPECSRFSLFDIAASIDQPHQELVVRYSFPQHIEHQDRIHEVLEMHQNLLACLADEEDDYDGDQSKALQMRHCPEDISCMLIDNMVDIEREVEAIYPASALQQHMLHRQSLEPWYYRVHGTWTVRGAVETASPVELDRLVKAWREVVHRHSTLRTVYHFSVEKQQYFAVVLRSVCPDIECIRENGDPYPTTLCKAEKALVPPHRMVLRDRGDGYTECLLEFSHVVIDAASRSIVLRDLVDAYEGRLYNRPLESLSFWEYIRQTQFPENRLVSPSSIGSLSPVGRVASLPVQLTYSDASLSRACREHEITFSSLFMSAWAIVLSRKLENSSVAFDYVLSDRSADIAGIEAAVGLYIRLPTCQMTVTPDVPATELAQRIHAQRTQAPGTGLLLPSDKAAAQQLTTLVNVRNSGTESLDMKSETMQWSLKGFDDPWDYDLVLAVNLRGSRVLGCSIDYADGVVAESVAFAFSQEMTKAVEIMVRDMGHVEEELHDIDLR